jgi:spore coat protein U-like protein
VDFYFVQPAGSPAGYEIRYSNSNVLYTLPATHSLSVTSPPSGTVFFDFGGNGQPNTVSIPLVVTIPPGLDLSAGDPIAFDIVYICNGRGALRDVTARTTLADAITIKINVLSAVQASYAGPALDFGEVGSLTDIASFTHSVTGMVRVASSGPYTVTMASANAYRMTFPGGSLVTSVQNIKYGSHFLGQNNDAANATFNETACKRAGTGGENLPLIVTLREGGVAKTPAPDYRDTLTVTITPLVVPYGGLSWSCPTL